MLNSNVARFFMKFAGWGADAIQEAFTLKMIFHLHEEIVVVAHPGKTGLLTGLVEHETGRQDNMVIAVVLELKPLETAVLRKKAE